jgi:alpha-ketoglutarate-dependent taurine dioxygenase
MSHELEVRDLPAPYGVEIVGLDTHRELDDASCAILRRAFDERGLLLFRDLDLSADYQAHLASSVIGQMGGTATGKEADAADPAYVSNKEPGGNAPYGRLLFHSDMMWADTPFQVLTLFGLEIAEPAVPTAFTSAALAWDTLPADLRSRVEGLHAVHVTGQQARAADGEGELLQPIRTHAQSTTKPIGYVHPRTGRTLLYVCQMMTEKIDELPAGESEELLEALFAHLYSPALLWEHAWRNGDLVLWDNLAIQHARKDVAIDGPVRTLRKVIAPKPVLSRPAEAPKFSKIG